MTVKERLRLLVEELSEEQAAQVLPLVEGQVTRGDDQWADARRALDRLHQLTADLPPFDAVRVAREARLELEQRSAS